MNRSKHSGVSLVGATVFASTMLGACIVNRNGNDAGAGGSGAAQSSSGQGGMATPTTTTASGGNTASVGTGAGGTGAGGNAATTTGAGGSTPCVQGATESCYSGPSGTQGVGLCLAGTTTCDGQGIWGPCVGEQLPATEDCYTLDDESCDGVAQCLPGAGLIVRYFLDEAASGKVPTAVVDSAPTPANLAGNYVGSMQFATSDGSRGLNWGATEESGRFQVSPGPAKLYNALNGQNTATIEIVAKVAAASVDHSRFMAWGGGGEDSADFTFGVAGNGLIFRSNDDDVWVRWPHTASNVREVYHVVIDRGLALLERHRTFVNGVPLNVVVIARNIGNAIDDPLELAQAKLLTLGNRHDGTRSIQGFIGYVAIYDEAFSASRVAHHSKLLGVGDDASNVPVE